MSTALSRRVLHHLHTILPPFAPAHLISLTIFSLWRALLASRAGGIPQPRALRCVFQRKGARVTKEANFPAPATSHRQRFYDSPRPSYVSRSSITSASAESFVQHYYAWRGWRRGVHGPNPLMPSRNQFVLVAMWRLRCCVFHLHNNQNQPQQRQKQPQAAATPTRHTRQFLTRTSHISPRSVANQQQQLPPTHSHTYTLPPLSLSISNVASSIRVRRRIFSFIHFTATQGSGYWTDFCGNSTASS